MLKAIKEHFEPVKHHIIEGIRYYKEGIPLLLKGLMAAASGMFLLVLGVSGIILMTLMNCMLMLGIYFMICCIIELFQ